MNPLKILIMVPPLNKPGGVANYYKALKGRFASDVTYFTRGKRQGFVTLPTALYYFYDFIYFTIKLLLHEYDLVIINTSLAHAGCSRDRVYINICRLFNKKFIVFFRGWDDNYALKISKQPQKTPIPNFFKASAIIVLASDFKDKLKDWGYTGPIHIESTVVDSNLVEKTDFKYLNKKYLNPKSFNILFLARVTKQKGVLDILKTFDFLQKENLPYQLTLTIAGTGSYLDELKAIAQNMELKNVFFPGHISGLKKREALVNADMFFFPTRHGEGMPNSILEAMAFGLPIVTRPVGGIKDIFEDYKMGRITESVSAKEYVHIIKGLLSQPETLQEITLYNHHYAIQNYTSDSVIARLESIFSSIQHSPSSQVYA